MNTPTLFRKSDRGQLIATWALNGVFNYSAAPEIKKKSKHQGRKTYDRRHRHSTDEGIPYKFVDGHQLLKDFWLEVDKTLRALGLEEEQS